MAKFIMVVDSESASFADDAEQELMHLLWLVKRRVDNGTTEGKLYDSNGVHVGRWKWRNQ